MERLRKLFDSVARKGKAELKELVRYQMGTVRKRIEQLEEKIVTAETFMGFADDYADDKFDYGNHPILKNH